MNPWIVFAMLAGFAAVVFLMLRCGKTDAADTDLQPAAPDADDGATAQPQDSGGGPRSTPR